MVFFFCFYCCGLFHSLSIYLSIFSSKSINVITSFRDLNCVCVYRRSDSHYLSSCSYPQTQASFQVGKEFIVILFTAIFSLFLCSNFMDNLRIFKGLLFELHTILAPCATCFIMTFSFRIIPHIMSRRQNYSQNPLNVELPISQVLIKNLINLPCIQIQIVMNTSKRFRTATIAQILLSVTRIPISSSPNASL